MRNRLMRSLLAAVLAVSGALVAPHAADASGGPSGVLKIRATGTTFATANGDVTSVTTPGGTATFTFTVTNGSALTSQYNLTLNLRAQFCASTCNPTLTIAAGSLLVTTLVAGPSGYFTAPINPGKTATFTFKVKMPSTAGMEDFEYYGINLNNTAGTLLQSVGAEAEIKASTGTSAHDEYVAASGQSSVIGGMTGGEFVSSAALKIGGTATFTIKLQNDSTASAKPGFAFVPGAAQTASCLANFAITLKVGSTDITALANGGYEPTIAAKKSVLITVTVKYLTLATTCSASQPFVYWQSSTLDSGGNVDLAYLLVDIAG